MAPITSSGTQRVRPYGHRYVVAVTDQHEQVHTFTLGDLSVHGAMRTAAKRVLAEGLEVLGVTGARVTAKGRRRGRTSLPTPVVPTDWDAITAGRHGLRNDDD